MTLRTCVIVLGRLVRYALRPSRWDGRLHDVFITTLTAGKARERDAIAEILHYPRCWDDLAYPTLEDAVYEFWDGCQACESCSSCDHPRQYHDQGVGSCMWDDCGCQDYVGERKVHPAAAAVADLVRGAALNMMPDVPKVDCPSCGRLMVRLSNLDRYHCFICGCWLPFEDVEEVVR